MTTYDRQRKGTIAFAVLSTLLTANMLFAQETSATSASGTNQNGSDKGRLERVHAKKLDGFELSRKSSDSKTQVAGASRGFGTETTLLAPHKGKAYGLNPLFQWSNPNAKIKSYTFRLLGPDHESVIYETEVSGTSWKYSQEAPALKPGASYFWTVQPSVKVLGEPADAAEIVIEGGEGREKVTAQLASLPDPSQQRAEVFVNDRFWYDAIEMYTRLIAANPSDPQLFQDRADLYDQLPQTSHAAENDRQHSGPPQQ